MIASRNLIPHRARKQVHAFSGIVRCGKCGHCLTFGKNTTNNNKMLMKPCWYKDHLGNVCRNGGFLLSEFEKLILNEIRNFKDNFAIQEAEMTQINVDTVKKLIEEKELSLKKFKNAVDVVNDSYELGDYTREVWIERKKKWEDRINITTNEISSLNRFFNGFKSFV